jgi:ubiquinone/menaquinone biosynthesis C-methylase UbiE
MNKGKITSWIRQLGLMHGFDKLKYYANKIKNRSKNNQFLQKYPHIALPPDYLIFESFKLDYEKYFIGGKESAVWIRDEISAFTDTKNLKILDWGCGPARILRHLPEVFNDNCTFFGVDYNPKSIEWCQKHLKGISFSKNSLNPPLSFESAQFDVIYGISIFTHLSKNNHFDWFNELNRVSKKGGIILLTTQGEAYKAIMTEKEQLEFDNHQLVIRDNVVEGHRVFSAFQPPVFMRNLFETHYDILLHQSGQLESWGINQDLWILRKKDPSV